MMTTVWQSRLGENYIVGPRAVGQRMRSTGGEPLTVTYGRRSSSLFDMKFRFGRPFRLYNHRSFHIQGSVRLYLTPDILHQLCVEQGTRCHITFDPSTRTLRLGPVVGIFACYRLGDPTFYGQGPFFRFLIDVAYRMGVCAYLFAPTDIDWDTGLVRGLIPRRGRVGWLRETFPLPNVVYNRIQNRSLEGQDDVQEALNRFEQTGGVSVFNRRFLDKWDVHTLLSQRRELRRYVPPTEKLTGVTSLRSLFADNSQLFVKPVDGSLGADIAVLQREGDGTYSYDYYAERGLMRGRRLPSLPALWDDLSRRLSPRPFIVQQAIRLAKYKGRRFDMRLIVQRGAGRRWRLGTMYARVARRGEYRTNVDVGGRTMPWRNVLRGSFGRRASVVAARLFKAARAIADGFAAAHGYIVGELAIDIGLDKAGRPFLIELNSKPVRRLGRRVSLRRPPRSIVSLLHFSKTLAGF